MHPVMSGMHSVALLASLAKFLAVLSMQPSTRVMHAAFRLTVAAESKLRASLSAQPKTS